MKAIKEDEANYSCSDMFKNLMPYYRIGLMREIARPIEKKFFKTLMIQIYNALLQVVTLAVPNKTISKESIQYEESKGGSGLMTKAGFPILVQFSITDESDESLVYCLVGHVSFNQLIQSLPESEHKIFLHCLNLQPIYEVLAEHEKAELKQACEIKLQAKKTW